MKLTIPEIEFFRNRLLFDSQNICCEIKESYIKVVNDIDRLVNLLKEKEK